MNNAAELFRVSFTQILEDPEEERYTQAMPLLRTCADDKGIEFDGYFNARWADSADTIVNFDEGYFQDEERTELYVFLSAMVDDEIFDFLAEVIRALNQKEITRELVEQRIRFLTKAKGVWF